MRLRPKKLVLVSVLGALAPQVAGCGVAACCYVTTHPKKTADAVRYGVDRLDPKQRAEDFKRIAEGDLRDRDFESYVAFVVRELRLKDVLAYEMSHEGYDFGYRLDTVDAFAGPDGRYTATARLEVIPDYGKLVNEGVKTAFGFWGKILPDKLVTRVGRDLTLGNRMVGQFLNVGVDEADVDLVLVRPDGREVPLGRARTDVSGRATVTQASTPLPADLASGAYAIVARLAPTHLPPGMKADTKVAIEGGGFLFVRRADDPPARVVIVNVSNTIFDLSSPKAIWGALREQRYELVDPCTAPAIAALSSAHRLVFLSGNPEGMAPLMRDELARTKLLGGDGEPGGAAAPRVPLVFKPHDLALGHERMLDFKTKALAAQAAFWGKDAIDGYIADDPEIDGAAAQAAGIPFLPLPTREKGGWCAGIPPLVPAR